MSALNPASVEHQTAAARFVLHVDGLLCELNYRLDHPVLHLVRTYVPPALEGRGLASLLVAAAVQYARSASLQIAPDCSYVEGWMQRHPEHQDLLARI